MTDNNEDIDDFDIYADLDDNIDLNFNETDNCFANYKNFSEIDLPSILTKTAETNDEINEKITENQIEIKDNVDFETEECEISIKTKEKSLNVNKPETEPSNDLILSEITILEKSLHKTEDNNKSLVKQNIELRQQLKEKDKQLTVLKTNISSLFKTAKAEIERKKGEIHELREQLDSMIFRRLPRNGIKVDNNNETPLQQNQNKPEEQTSVCEKSSQTTDRDLRHNSNSHKKSPDSSVRSPKERPTTQRRSRRSRSKSCHKTQRRSRSRSQRRNRNSPSKSTQKTHKSRSKSPMKTRRSRSKSPQRRRRTRSRSSQPNKRERQRSPIKDRHRTNTEKKSETSSKPKTEDKKRKSDKSDAKTDPKRSQKSDKKK